MNERAIEIKVGALVAAAVGILVAFVVVLGNFSLAEGFTFSVDFDFSGNLQTGAPVKVAGIKVGKVDAVEYLGGRLDPASKRRVYVRVRAWVEQRVSGTIHQDAEFFINTQGVLGEQYLEVVPGSPGKPPIRPGQVLAGVTPPRMDLVVARLFSVLDGVTRLLRDEKETIRRLLKAGALALGSVDKLLTENQDNIKKLLAGLDDLVAEASQLLKGVRGGLGDPRRLGTLVANLEKTSASLGRNIDGLMRRADNTLAGVERLSGMVGSEEEAKIKKTLDRVYALTGDMAQLTGDARLLVADLGKGKGTAGALLVNRELYDDLKEMVRDLKRNPWKFLWRE